MNSLYTPYDKLVNETKNNKNINTSYDVYNEFLF